MLDVCDNNEVLSETYASTRLYGNYVDAVL